MIYSIFPNNILLQDYDLSEEWSSGITEFCKYAFSKATEEEYFGVFSNENIQLFPQLLDLKNMFADSYISLSESYSSEKINKDDILNKLHNRGWVHFMEKGDYSQIHNHGNKCSAYAVFYPQQLEKEDGGVFVLHDPSFFSPNQFTNESTYNIQINKNRMLAASNKLWHEIKPYFGKDIRYSIVTSI